MGAFFTDSSGKERLMVMGCYGIGLGRLLAAIIEQNHDDKGIIWPVSITPYHVYLCPLYLDNPEVAGIAEQVYRDLELAGLEVIFDDRDESPGVKFNDADLLGIPIRVTVSPRTLEKDSAEVKRRWEKKAQLIPLAELSTQLKQMVAENQLAPSEPVSPQSS
jgi:prolyl-tRNA synthetase